MTHLFGVLNIGTSALLAQQRAINVTGNNIANVNTPGYSRQKVNLETNLPTQTGLGPMSFGVTSTGVERIYDRFIGLQLNKESTSLGRWEAQRGMLERVEVVFDESAGYGLNQALSDFWNAWQALSFHPSGTTERSMVAATSEGLADAIRQKYGELEQIREDIDTAVESGIATINRLTAQIADLNQKIARTEIGGTNANDYRDRRDLVLKQLAEMIDILKVQAAATAIERIYRQGFEYKKAGVLLNNLVPQERIQRTLFETADREKSGRLMRTIDAINRPRGLPYSLGSRRDG